MRELLDVDRWDRATEGQQDAAIAEVTRLVAPAFEWVRTERFTARQHRTRSETCSSCGGRGGEMPQSGSTEYPDCDVCNNSHVIEKPFESEPLSHRVAMFRHRATGGDFVLVPGRIDIPACLVGIQPFAGADMPSGFRTLTASEARHACLRAGMFDLTWEAGTWTEHPFGLADSTPTASTGSSASSAASRLACTVPALVEAQVAAFHELVDEVGPIETVAAGEYIARTGYGTADPPGHVHALAWSRDGKWLATGHSRGVRVWDAANGRQLSRCALSSEKDFSVESVTISPDNTRLVAASAEMIEMFDMATGESIARQGAGLPESRMAPHYNQHRAVAWLPSGKLLVVEATLEKRGVFWSLVDPESGQLERSAEATYDDYLYDLRLATSFDGTRAAVSLVANKTLAIWDVENWRVATTIAVERASHVAIGGDTVLVNGRDKVIAYSLAKGTEEQVGSTALSFVALSPDGRYGAWKSWDGVNVVDMASRAQRSVGRHTSVPIAFAPDGQRIAAQLASCAAIWRV
jgi:hypothetical protein